MGEDAYSRNSRLAIARTLLMVPDTVHCALAVPYAHRGHGISRRNSRRILTRMG